MKKHPKKISEEEIMTKMTMRYASTSGSILVFQVDRDIAKQYGLEEVIELVADADEDYVEGLKYWNKLTEVTRLKKTRKITKYKGLLKQQGEKGRIKTNKAHKVLKSKLKTMKKLPILDTKLIDKREADFIRQIMKLKLEDQEKELIQTEFAENRMILDQEGTLGIVKKIHAKLEEMDELLIDPIKATEHRSTAAFCIIWLIILAAGFIICTIYMIWWFLEPFLGNSNTKEIHDGTRVKDACQVNEILDDHKVWIGTQEEIESAVFNRGYNGCAHCLPELHTG